MVEDLIILGSGPAGLSAALYTSREDFKTLVISGVSAGGQLMLTNIVENFPGFPDGVLGQELIEKMRKQAERFGTKFVEGDVTKVDFSVRPFKVFTEDQIYEANSIIVSTGASAKWLGIESEKKFIGKGISSCATCDGAFFKGKDVVVVGGGDTAMEDSLFLTRFANSVTIVHRRDSLKASKIMQERVFSNQKIKFIWDSTVEEIKGSEKVEGVRIKNLKTNQMQEVKVQGVFVAIGYTPNSSIFKDFLELDPAGYIITRDEVKTKIEGVYVAGDVSDRFYKQAVTASASGVKAALHVREYLSTLKYEQGKKKS